MIVTSCFEWLTKAKEVHIRHWHDRFADLAAEVTVVRSQTQAQVVGAIYLGKMANL